MGPPSSQLCQSGACSEGLPGEPAPPVTPLAQPCQDITHSHRHSRGADVQNYKAQSLPQRMTLLSPPPQVAQGSAKESAESGNCSPLEEPRVGRDLSSQWGLGRGPVGGTGSWPPACRCTAASGGRRRGGQHIVAGSERGPERARPSQVTPGPREDTELPSGSRFKVETQRRGTGGMTRRLIFIPQPRRRRPTPLRAPQMRMWKVLQRRRP